MQRGVCKRYRSSRTAAYATGWCTRRSCAHARYAQDQAEASPYLSIAMPVPYFQPPAGTGQVRVSQNAATAPRFCTQVKTNSSPPTNGDGQTTAVTPSRTLCTRRQRQIATDSDCPARRPSPSSLHLHGSFHDGTTGRWSWNGVLKLTIQPIAHVVCPLCTDRGLGYCQTDAVVVTVRTRLATTKFPFQHRQDLHITCTVSDAGQ